MGSLSGLRLPWGGRLLALIVLPTPPHTHTSQGPGVQKPITLVC